MADQYIGEIRMFSWPQGHLPETWLPCNGQELQVNNYKALYALIGNMYGGTANTTFKLPMLNGRTIMGAGVTAGKKHPGVTGGAPGVAVTTSNMPAHTHNLQVSSNAGTAQALKGNIFAAVATGQKLYGSMASNVVAIDPNVIVSAGDGAAHNNMQPYVPFLFAIAVFGIFPPRP
jgi:microcystin-dependent protein